MRNLGKKLNDLAWKAHFKAEDMKAKAVNAIKNEDGDTNFLSIIIILAIVLVVAVVFISLKDQIIDLVEGAWNAFKAKFGGQTNPF